MTKILKRIYEGTIQFFRNISLKNKLLLLFCLQITVFIVFIGYASYNKSAETIKKKSIGYSQDLIKMIQLRIEDMSKDIDSLTLQLLYDNRVYDFLKANNFQGSSQYSNSSYIRSLLRDSTLTRDAIESMCLVTNSNSYIYYDSDSRNMSIRDKLPYDYIYREASLNKGKTSWILYSVNGTVLDIYAVRVVYDRDDYRTPLGLIAILIKKDFIESLYQQVSQESVNNITILSDNYEEVLKKADDKNYMKILKEREQTEQRGYFVDNENKILVSYVTMTNPNWSIVYHVPLKELYKEISNLRIKISLIVIWSIAILSLLSSLTAMDIVKPIKELVDAMKELESNGKHKQVNTNRNDEIGYLQRSFNKMSSRIHYLLNIIYKEKLTRKEAEIKALQAQINPHFLFNTLENINWMAQLNGIPEISNTVTALAKLMEANIGREEELITLREEFEYIDNYIAILKNRYEDRLQVYKNIEEETLEVMIPRLLIQPVIENAIHHGLEGVIRQGEIRINSYFSEGDIIVEVEDNGIGMKAEELADLGRILKGEKIKGKTSIGLNNVNKRIKLFYGESYGVKVESQYDKYTRVTIRVPLKAIKGVGEYYV